MTAAEIWRRRGSTVVERERDGSQVDGMAMVREERKNVVGKRVKGKRKREKKERLRRESEDEEKDERVDPGGGISKCAVQRLGGAAFFEGWLALNKIITQRPSKGQSDS